MGTKKSQHGKISRNPLKEKIDAEEWRPVVSYHKPAHIRKSKKNVPTRPDGAEGV